nr:hypothetical protein Itr_chr03CG10510 [Ipomoea trifida]
MEKKPLAIYVCLIEQEQKRIKGGRKNTDRYIRSPRSVCYLLVSSSTFQRGRKKRLFFPKLYI